VRESGRKSDCSDRRAVESFDVWFFGSFVSAACCARAEPLWPHGPDDAIHSPAACIAVNAAEPSCSGRVVSQRRCSGFVLETPCAPLVRLSVSFFFPRSGALCEVIAPLVLRRNCRSSICCLRRESCCFFFFLGFVPLQTSPGSTPSIQFYSPPQHNMPI
jgi:hypothetical protein